MLLNKLVDSSIGQAVEYGGRYRVGPLSYLVVTQDNTNDDDDDDCETVVSPFEQACYCSAFVSKLYGFQCHNNCSGWMGTYSEQAMASHRTTAVDECIPRIGIMFYPNVQTICC